MGTKQSKKAVDIDRDVQDFTNLHSWYKHEPIVRSAVFYPVLTSGVQRGHQIQIDGKEGTKLHFHFYSDLTGLTKVDKRLLDISAKYPFKISCFLSCFANVTLSLRKAKENKQYWTSVKGYVDGKKEFRDIAQSQYGGPETDGLSLNNSLTLISEFYEQEEAKEIMDGKKQMPEIPPDVFDFVEKYYPEKYDIIKEYRDTEHYEYNRELKDALESIIRTEYDIQIQDAKDACQHVYQDALAQKLL